MSVTEPKVQFSEEAEKGLVGCCLITPDYIDKVAQFIAPEDFFSPACQIVFKHAVAMRNEGKPVDFKLLSIRLRDAGQLDAIGGVAALNDFWTFTPTSVNWLHFAEIVQDKSRLRAAIRSAGEILVRANESSATSDEIDTMIQDIATSAARHAQSGSDTQHIKGLTLRAVNRMEERYDGKDTFRGILCGLTAVDKLARGWKAGQVIIIAAQAKHGKSSLARQFAMEAAFAGVAVGYFSLEMSGDEITDAMISQRSKVDATSIGKLMSERDIDRLMKAGREIGGTNIEVRDEADMTTNQFRAAARVMKMQKAIGMIVVDYLQLMTASGKHDNRQGAVSEISRALKLCAKELQIPIIALSQLNDDGKTRDSRTIEMDCDILIKIHHQGGEPPHNEPASPAWIEIKRHRGGPTGLCPATWLGPSTSFENRAWDNAIDNHPELDGGDKKKKSNWRNRHS